MKKNIVPFYLVLLLGALLGGRTSSATETRIVGQEAAAMFDLLVEAGTAVQSGHGLMGVMVTSLTCTQAKTMLFPSECSMTILDETGTDVEKGIQGDLAARLTEALIHAGAGSCAMESCVATVESVICMNALPANAGDRQPECVLE